jgi:hypothetical protein
MEAAQRFIAEEYGKCKRQKMFQDGETAGDPPTHCGYVYGFRNEEYSHDSTPSCHSKSHWFEQHWVTFYNRNLIDMACLPKAARRPAAVRQGEKS